MRTIVQKSCFCARRNRLFRFSGYLSKPKDTDIEGQNISWSTLQDHQGFQINCATKKKSTQALTLGGWRDKNAPEMNAKISPVAIFERTNTTVRQKGRNHHEYISNRLEKQTRHKPSRLCMWDIAPTLDQLCRQGMAIVMLGPKLQQCSDSRCPHLQSDRVRRTDCPDVRLLQRPRWDLHIEGRNYLAKRQSFRNMRSSTIEIQKVGQADAGI